MVWVVELVSTLLLGFVLGRIWEIRQQMQQAEPVGNRQRPVDGGVAERKPLPTLDRRKKDLPVAPALAERRYHNPAVREARG